VEFDLLKIHTFVKNLRQRGVSDQEISENLLFCHVHPEGFGPFYSGQDVICCKGLTKGLGLESIRFEIVTFSQTDNVKNLDIFSIEYNYKKNEGFEKNTFQYKGSTQGLYMRFTKIKYQALYLLSYGDE
jgi:hypothetical protein